MTLSILLLLACRPDPGDPSYPDPSASDTGDTGGDDNFYSGPDPYVDGDSRLSLGAFYENGSSVEIPVDDVTRHYYIYSATYTQTVDLINRVEGYQADVIVHGGGDWWGGGITWDSAEDLSAWTTMHVSLASGSDSFASIELHFAGGGTEAIVQATDYGYSNDGNWYHLAIPLSDFTGQGADQTSVTGPFVLIGTAGDAGEELRVDNLYFTGD